MNDRVLLTINGLAIPQSNGIEQKVPKILLRPHSCTVVYGPNGSGKSFVSRVIAGDIRISDELIHCAPEIDEKGGRRKLVSFDSAVTLLQEERYNDESDLTGGGKDLGRSICEYLELNGKASSDQAEELLQRFHLAEITSRGLRALSSGELRKTMIVKALLADPLILILDDPFDGLDIDSRRELTKIMPEITRHCALVLAVGRRREIPDCADTTIMLESPSLENAPEAYDALHYWREHPHQSKNTDEDSGSSLIEMRGVSVAYNGIRILHEINWRVERNEAWRIAGPNGAGKTTLLELINGDNPKAYGQELYLFGRRKGSGETVWDIKRRIGHVSSALHMRQLERSRIEELLLSGYFDTSGLYDKPTGRQIEEAREWAELFGISRFLQQRMNQVSFGIQRVALIVRGLIKEPELLLLDEPCHGLDDRNSDLVLNAAQTVAEQKLSTLLFVSHDPAHQIAALTHCLTLTAHPDGGHTATVDELETNEMKL